MVHDIIVVKKNRFQTSWMDSTMVMEINDPHTLGVDLSGMYNHALMEGLQYFLPCTGFHWQSICSQNCQYCLTSSGGCELTCGQSSRTTVTSGLNSSDVFVFYLYSSRYSSDTDETLCIMQVSAASFIFSVSGRFPRLRLSANWIFTPFLYSGVRS